MPKKETYAEARIRLFGELSKAGLVVKPTLKVPQVRLKSGETLYFRTQAVYLEAHSLWTDIRGMSAQTFLGVVMTAIKVRQTHDDAAVNGWLNGQTSA